MHINKIDIVIVTDTIIIIVIFEQNITLIHVLGAFPKCVRYHLNSVPLAVLEALNCLLLGALPSGRITSWTAID